MPQTPRQQKVNLGVLLARDMIFRSCQRVHDSSPTLVPWMMAPSVSLTSWCSTSGARGRYELYRPITMEGLENAYPHVYIICMEYVYVYVHIHLFVACTNDVYMYIIYNHIYRRVAFQIIWIIYYLHLFTKATWTVTICLDIICIIVRYCKTVWYFGWWH